MNDKQIVICGSEYRTKAAVTKVCRSIIATATDYQPLTERHSRFVAELFRRHPEYLEKSFPGIRAFSVATDSRWRTTRREPSIWAPLIKACAEKGYSVLDMNAALAAHLRTIGPLWLTVYSGGSSLQSWFPCKGVAEQELNAWRLEEVMPLGACSSTWCRSQFVRMPDGQRDDGARQSIEYYNPKIFQMLTL
jgi:hypothetical protein